VTYEHLHARIRQARSRAAVLRWEARQSALARGVWYRLRRLLTFAAEMWSVDEETMDRLIASGSVPAPEGEQIDPAKRIVTLSRDRRDEIAGGRRLPVRMSPEFFAARNLVLIPWRHEPQRGRPRPEGGMLESGPGAQG
jgi:hypothetical protein